MGIGRITTSCYSLQIVLLVSGGKSALLAGLVMALGGSASTLGRGTKMAAYVRDEQE